MAGSRVIKIAPGEDGQAWIDAISDPAWRDSAELLKRDRGVSVWRAQMLGRDVVVKCWSLKRLKRRLQAIFNASPAVRQWCGAALLTEREIPTAATYALVRVRLDDDPCECLVMESLPGKSVLEYLAFRELTVRQEHALASALGRQIVNMILAKASNLDHKPSNLIVCDLDRPTPSVIDTVAIEGLDGSDDEGYFAYQMLADLLIEPTGCDCPPRRTLMLRAALQVADEQLNWNPGVTRKQLVLEAWDEVSQEMNKRGDLTPKVDPLAHVRRSDG